jgi:6-pyruvoyl-tetrahydropterin synthase
MQPILERLDHRYIVSNENIECNDPYIGVAPAGHVVHLPIDRSTAECISQWMIEALDTVMPEGVMVDRIVIWETPKSSAEI